MTPPDSPDVDCAAAAEQVHALLDGEMDEPAASRLLDHLEACPPCGMEEEVYRRLKEAVAGCGNCVDPSTLERLRAFAADVGADTGSPP